MPVCKRCGRTVTKVSARGLCRDCSQKAVKEAIASLQEKKGEIYEKWQERIIKAIEKSKYKRELLTLEKSKKEE